MKSKSIPLDIRTKSIKEARNEINTIIESLEDQKTDLKQSVDKYNRMMQLNTYIQEEFRKKIKEIKISSSKKKTTKKEIK